MQKTSEVTEQPIKKNNRSTNHGVFAIIGGDVVVTIAIGAHRVVQVLDSVRLVFGLFHRGWCLTLDRHIRARIHRLFPAQRLADARLPHTGPHPGHSAARLAARLSPHRADRVPSGGVRRRHAHLVELSHHQLPGLRPHLAQRGHGPRDECRLCHALHTLLSDHLVLLRGEARARHRHSRVGLRPRLVRHLAAHREPHRPLRLARHLLPIRRHQLAPLHLGLLVSTEA